MIQVSYDQLVREFPSMRRAKQWARQCGVYDKCQFTDTAPRVDINSILKAHPVHSRYGAPMGARNIVSDSPGKLHLQRIRLVDGDYDPSGVYWGYVRFEPMWTAFSHDLSTLIYVRDKTRESAKVAILEQYPNLEFIK